MWVSRSRSGAPSFRDLGFGSAKLTVRCDGQGLFRSGALTQAAVRDSTVVLSPWQRSACRCVPCVGEAYGERRFGAPVELACCKGGVDHAVPQITWALGRKAWFPLDAGGLGTETV